MPIRLDDHAADPRVDRQPGEAAAETGQPVVTRSVIVAEGPEFEEQPTAVGDLSLIGWVDEREVLHPTEPDPATLERLERSWTKQWPGDPKSTLGNAVAVLCFDPRWCGRIRRDVMRDRLTLDGAALEDEDVHELRLWMQGVYGFCPSTVSAFEAVQVVGRRNQWNPLQEWLNGLEWDQRERVDYMLTDRFGCDGSDLVRAMSRCFMVGLVARALDPGCQMDSVLILKGNQGIRKTSGLRALAGPEWFASPHINVQSKDTAISLRGKWLIEWAELDSM
ncbi:MAG: hypothetical protein EBS10_07705, partial [Acidimicrobiia bacterium]|nr:hypothetical protein [Acidimicrobiia bacterium]